MSSARSSRFMNTGSFVEGVILGINSFDQWGVELGKELATSLEPVLAGEVSAEGKDGSTRMLVAALRGE
jgi:glucose-6-phosphate isomerase